MSSRSAVAEFVPQDEEGGRSSLRIDTSFPTFTVAKHPSYPSCRNKKCRGHPEGSGDFHGNKANKAKDGSIYLAEVER